MTPKILEFLKQSVPAAASVIEIGSMNVNGSARSVVSHEHWLGTDMRDGHCVDWVVDAAKLPQYLGAVFDAVVCCETLEHCSDWQSVFLALVSLAKPQTGVVVITVPAPGFPRHDYPSDYWRFTLADLIKLAGTCEVLASGEWRDSANSPGVGIVFRRTGVTNAGDVVPARI